MISRMMNAKACADSRERLPAGVPGGAPGVSRQIVLASASAERARLLGALGLTFDVDPSGVEERGLPGEGASGRAARLAAEKCARVGARRRDAIVVAADTCAFAGPPVSAVLGKPGSRARAEKDLASLSGRTVGFRTAVCVRDPGAGDAAPQVRESRGEIALAELDGRRIRHYLDTEPAAPGAAAGFVADGAGPAICARISEDEPGTLSGLPMISLCRLLRSAGVALP